MKAQIQSVQAKIQKLRESTTGSYTTVGYLLDNILDMHVCDMLGINPIMNLDLEKINEEFLQNTEESVNSILIRAKHFPENT